MKTWCELIVTLEYPFAARHELSELREACRPYLDTSFAKEWCLTQLEIP